MRPFTLYRPDSLEDAVGKRPDAVFKAAGIDLLDRLKERVESPPAVIDLSRLDDGMRVLEAKDGRISIGALRTLAEVAAAPLLAGRAHRALVEAAGEAATPAVRNRATVGGNLLQKARCWYLRSAQFGCAHGGDGPLCLALTGENRYHSVLGYHDCVRVHPSSLAPALYVLDAQVVWRTREVMLQNAPITALYPKEPVARAAEHVLPADGVLLFVQLPPFPAGTRSAFRESRERQSFDWATTAAAVRLRIEQGKIADAAICLGAVAPNPYPATQAAKYLVGKESSAATFTQCAELAFRDAAPLSQNAYKVPVGKAVLMDALTAAAKEE